MNISVQVSIAQVCPDNHLLCICLTPSLATVPTNLGGHHRHPDDAFNPQHTLATLGQTSTKLGKDFIPLVKCANLSSPAALLEVHPAIPNSKALMVTLIPKFNLSKSAMPEVVTVFIVERSGRMYSHIAPLKSSLSVFLKSLLLDVNICSFGSQLSFLWEKSRLYFNQSFAETQRHCDGMQADFGGTEILLSNRPSRGASRI